MNESFFLKKLFGAPQKLSSQPNFFLVKLEEIDAKMGKHLKDLYKKLILKKAAEIFLETYIFRRFFWLEMRRFYNHHMDNDYKLNLAKLYPHGSLERRL